MSTEKKSLQAALERLSKMNVAPKKQNSKYFQCKEGRNDVLVLPLTADGHPFAEWFVHKGLIDPAKPWFAIACDKHNDGGECVICDMANALKDQNIKGNEALWKLLEATKEMYSPVIDLNDVDAGVQWWSYGRSISGQFETWLKNLDEDEKPFYDPAGPQKVIVTYTKEAAPKDKYKLDRKNLKPIAESQYEKWFGTIKPIDQVRNNRKTEDEKEQILAAYVKGKEKQLKSMTVETPAPKAVAKPVAKAPSSGVGAEEEEEEEQTVVTPKAAAKVTTPSAGKSKLHSLNTEEED